jgi:riboflavin synthase
MGGLMFTGIVAELGHVVAVETLADDSARLTIAGPVVLADAGLGDSIAVNGVCLTVVATDGQEFTADVMRETLVRSSLGRLAVDSSVNLERPMSVNGRFDGHLVQGHVDGVGRVLHRQHSTNWDVVRIWLPTDIARYVVEKGSITVDGISLTVSAIGREGSDWWFEVSLIPATLAHTTLGTARSNSEVNLEVDVIAKYVERLTEWRNA